MISYKRINSKKEDKNLAGKTPKEASMFIAKRILSICLILTMLMPYFIIPASADTGTQNNMDGITSPNYPSIKPSGINLHEIGYSGNPNNAPVENYVLCTDGTIDANNGGIYYTVDASQAGLNDQALAIAYKYANEHEELATTVTEHFWATNNDEKVVLAAAQAAMYNSTVSSDWTAKKMSGVSNDILRLASEFDNAPQVTFSNTFSSPSFSGPTKGSGTPIELVLAEDGYLYASVTDTSSGTNYQSSYFDFNYLGDGIEYTWTSNVLRIKADPTVFAGLTNSKYGAYDSYNTKGIKVTKKSNTTWNNVTYYESGGSQPMIKIDPEEKDVSATAFLTLYTKSAGCGISIIKTSEDGNIANIQFDVTGPENFTLITDATGHASKTGITPGTYTITERAGAQYVPKQATSTVLEGQTWVWPVNNELMGVVVNVTKKDTKTDTTPQGNAQLNDAVYGLYDADTGTEINRYTVKNGTFQITNISTTKSYYLKELVAPDGYCLDPTTYPIDFSQAYTSGGVTTLNIGIAETVQKAPITIQKVDDIGGASLGAGSLAGAKFSVLNASRNPVYVEGGKRGNAIYNRGEVIQEVYTDDYGTAVTVELPYGEYTIREDEAPRGYLVGVGDAKTGAGFSQTVKNYNEYLREVKYDTIVEVQESLKRGDLEFNKIDQMERLIPKVVFIMTSKTTGEEHILVADENGEINTNYTKNPHTRDTNANDSLRITVNAKGEKQLVNEEDINTKAGLWFYGRNAADSVPVEGRGALPFDVYTVEEVRSSANADLVLLKFDVVISQPGYIVDLGSLTDLNPPAIQSRFYDSGTGRNYAIPSNRTTLEELVTLHSVERGRQYYLTCTIVDKDSGKVAYDANGQAMTKSKTITPSATEVDDIRFTFNINASNLKGKTLVATDVLETKIDGIRTIVAKHDLDTMIGDDLDAQTVAFPHMGTRLTNAAGEKEIGQLKNVTLIDAVDYTNLDITKDYVLKGELYLSSGEKLVDEIGNPIVETVNFRPYSPDGVQQVRFTLKDLTKYVGKSIVCFETLYLASSEVIVGEHKDLKDAEQTVTLPSIGTTATNGNGLKCIAAAGNQKVIDTVKYNNLVPNATYKLHGTLFVKDRNTYTTLIDDNGPVIVEMEFAADPSGSGSVNMEFVFDAYGLEGKELFVGETLLRNGDLVAIHEDPTDKGQTVYVPQITTTATDRNGGKTLAKDPNTIILDTMRYKNLAPGEGYTAHGILMNFATGEPFLEDGEPIESTQYFYANSSEGYITMEFAVNTEIATTGTIVVFETVMDANNEIIARHEDLNDLDQSVVIPVDLGTVATAEDGSKYVSFESIDSNVTILDTIHYKGLVAGHTYTANGLLVYKNTGVVVKDDSGNVIESLACTFTPDTDEGEVTVEFEVPAKLVAGKQIVVFERVKEGNVVIGTHEDINDEAQLVTVYTQVQIFKFDGNTDTGLPGAVLEITDETGGEVFRRTSNENGYVTFAGIPGHNYTYVEVIAPEGYEKSDKTGRIIVKTDGTVQGDTDLCNIQYGTVTITKLNILPTKFEDGHEENMPIMGAKVQILDENNIPVYTHLTDAEGKIYFKPSHAGTYRYKEISAPPGYYLNDSEYSFVVRKDGTAEGKLVFYDAPYGTIVITKTTPKGDRLPGATIAFYSSDGKLLGRGITDSDGKVYFVTKDAGTTTQGRQDFYFIEEAAPKGYVRNKSTFKVSIDQNYNISGTRTIVNNADPTPQTGENSHYTSWIIATAAGILCTIGLTGLYIRRRKKRTAAGK